MIQHPREPVDLSTVVCPIDGHARYGLSDEQIVKARTHAALVIEDAGDHAKEDALFYSDYESVTCGRVRVYFVVGSNDDVDGMPLVMGLEII